MGVLRCSVSQLTEVLGDEVSAATGTHALVVEGGLSAGSLSGRVRDRLRSLPAVTVALADDPDASREWPVDVVVPDEDSVAVVVSQITAHPQAALALAQLLRADLDGATGLDAESWVYSLLQAGPEFAAWLAARIPRAPHGDGEDLLIVQEGPGVCRLVLNRPHARNALNTALRERLAEALRALADRPDIAIELTGAGPSFSAGGDLTEFGTFPDPVTSHVVRCTRSPARWLAHLGPRLSVHLHGPCAGGGVELAAFAHRVDAHPKTTLHLPEVGMGLIPGAGGTVSIPRRIGRHRTAWLALSGQAIDALTALDWGLVDAIVEPESKDA